MNALTSVLRAVAVGKPLTRPQVRDAVEAMLVDDAVSDAQIGALLMALSVRGESTEEIVGAAEALLAHSASITGLENSIDTCGTGGDGSNTFNISTLSSIVLAATGISVVKHGNRSVSSRSGSADLIEALGIPLTLKPSPQLQTIHQITGITFLFAPHVHSKMKRIGPVRQALGVRTIFNLIGPLANPARPRAQLLGVAHSTLMQKMIEAARALGKQKVWVVHGNTERGGLDEVSLSGETEVLKLNQGNIDNFTITPEEFGLKRVPIGRLSIDSIGDSVRVAHSVLNAEPSDYLDAVVLNAAAALALWFDITFLDAAARARNAVVTGAAKAKFDSWKRASIT